MGWGFINAYGWSVGLHWNLMASAVWERKDHDYKNFGTNIREDGRGENTGKIAFLQEGMADSNLLLYP